MHKSEQRIFAAIGFPVFVLVCFLFFLERKPPITNATCEEAHMKVTPEYLRTSRSDKPSQRRFRLPLETDKNKSLLILLTIRSPNPMCFPSQYFLKVKEMKRLLLLMCRFLFRGYSQSCGVSWLPACPSCFNRKMLGPADDDDDAHRNSHNTKIFPNSEPR